MYRDPPRPPLVAVTVGGNGAGALINELVIGFLSHFTYPAQLVELRSY